MSEKKDLKEALKTILMGSAASTQEAIALRLKEAGFSVNQSKISRMLGQIGAIKVKNTAGQLIYTLPKEPPTLPTDARLKGLVLDIVHNEMLILIKTAPGAAQLIARLLDFHEENSQILGTVAGDDTIFVAPRSCQHIEATLIEIGQKLGLSN